MPTTPDMTTLRARAEELRRTLDYHARLYYVEDAPVISDYEYDRLYYELGHIEEAHPELDDPASPTHRVGGKALDKFDKVTHTARMDSLSDVFSYGELGDFVHRVKEIIPINLPYPRNQATKLLPEFNEYKNEIWAKVYKEYIEFKK